MAHVQEALAVATIHVLRPARGVTRVLFASMSPGAALSRLPPDLPGCDRDPPVPIRHVLTVAAMTRRAVKILRDDPKKVAPAFPPTAKGTHLLFSGGRHPL